MECDVLVVTKDLEKLLLPLDSLDQERFQKNWGTLVKGGNPVFLTKTGGVVLLKALGDDCDFYLVDPCACQVKWLGAVADYPPQSPRFLEAFAQQLYRNKVLSLNTHLEQLKRSLAQGHCYAPSILPVGAINYQDLKEDMTIHLDVNDFLEISWIYRGWLLELVELGLLPSSRIPGGEMPIFSMFTLRLDGEAVHGEKGCADRMVFPSLLNEKLSKAEAPEDELVDESSLDETDKKFFVRKELESLQVPLELVNSDSIMACWADVLPEPCDLLMINKGADLLVRGKETKKLYWFVEEDYEWLEVVEDVPFDPSDPEMIDHYSHQFYRFTVGTLGDDTYFCSHPEERDFFLYALNEEYWKACSHYVKCVLALAAYQNGKAPRLKLSDVSCQGVGARFKEWVREALTLPYNLSPEDIDSQNPLIRPGLFSVGMRRQMIKKQEGSIAEPSS